MTDVWPLALSVLISFLCILYLWEVARSFRGRRRLGIDISEGFTTGSDIDLRLDDKCYDAFYAKIYDLLVQPGARAPMETKIALEWMTQQGKPVGDIRVADIGCGTGMHAALFAKQGVRSVVGFDRSDAMIDVARSRWSDISGAPEFIVGDATVATMASAGQFDLVTMLYFTIYMVPERTQMLKNIFLWLAPGGTFAVHIVNKHKFDPVLEAASPSVGFSVQKYVDERLTKSSVTFEELDYTGDFQLHGKRGMYEEVFKFRDGRVRKHEQRLWMPDIADIVAEIEAIGFKLKHYVDLTVVSYEYNFIFMFAK